MTRGEALERLMVLVAHDSDPALSSRELALLVDGSSRVDVDGLEPQDDGWTPTYDLNAAAAEGWRWKAAKASGRFDFSTDRQSFNRSQVTEHCLAMAKQYARKTAGSVATPASRLPASSRQDWSQQV